MICVAALVVILQYEIVVLYGKKEPCLHQKDRLLTAFLNRPAVPLKLFGLISAVKEAALEELHGHHSEDEHEEHVDNQDIQYILQ